MPDYKSIYHQALEALLTTEYALLDTIHLVFSYKKLDFSPPREIHNSKIVYLMNLEKQAEQHRKNGLLRIFEIDPVFVVKNYLQVKISVSVSVNSTESNYDSILENLTLSEKNAFKKLGGSKAKPMNLFMNIETHLFDFLFDCERAEFILSKQQKVNSTL